MRFNKLLACLVSLGIFFSGSTAASTTAFAEPVNETAAVNVVNQGDRILVQDRYGRVFNCTAGFVDAVNGKIWTAGHCSHEGSIVKNQYGVPIGTLHHPYNIDENVDNLSGKDRTDAVAAYFFHDIGYVELDNVAFAGSNGFSGDRSYVPHAGEQMCRFGSTTRQVYCAKIFNVTNQIVYAADLNTKGGDSGGPAWVPGKGYIGQAVGSFNFTTADYRRTTMSIIHREDLASVVPQQTDQDGYSHYVPSENELLLNSYAIREAQSVYGKDLPDAKEFDAILREHELELKEAENKVEKAQLALQQAEGDAKDLQLQLASARQELTNLKAKLSEGLADKEELEKLKKEHTAEISNKVELENLKEEHARYKEESTIGLVIAILSALLGFGAAVAGWFAPRVPLRF